MVALQKAPNKHKTKAEKNKIQNITYAHNGRHTQFHKSKNRAKIRFEIVNKLKRVNEQEPKLCFAEMNNDIFHSVARARARARKNFSL